MWTLTLTITAARTLAAQTRTTACNRTPWESIIRAGLRLEPQEALWIQRAGLSYPVEPGEKGYQHAICGEDLVHARGPVYELGHNEEYPRL